MSENAYPIVQMTDVRRLEYIWTALKRGLNPSKRFSLEDLEQATIYLIRLRNVAEEVGLSPIDTNYPTMPEMINLENCFARLRA